MTFGRFSFIVGGEAWSNHPKTNYWLAMTLTVLMMSV